MKSSLLRCSRKILRNPCKMAISFRRSCRNNNTPWKWKNWTSWGVRLPCRWAHSPACAKLESAWNSRMESSPPWSRSAKKCSQGGHPRKCRQNFPRLLKCGEHKFESLVRRFQLPKRRIWSHRRCIQGRICEDTFGCRTSSYCTLESWKSWYLVCYQRKKGNKLTRHNWG